MRFSFCLMGVEVFTVEFAYPSRGVYPVPDYISSEFDSDFEPLLGEDEEEGN